MTEQVSRVQRWERRAEVPLLLLAVAFLVAYAWPVLDPHLSRDWRTTLAVVSWAVWGAFAVDFLIRLALADERGDYALSHWYDIALIAVPLLRPLRLLRLLTLVRILDRSASNSLAGRAAVYIAGSAAMAVLLGAIAVLDAEQHNPGANIKTFGDAIWWAGATVTTVGYGDRFPVTTQGRCVAGVLMVVGIGVVGSVTATVAAWLVERAEARRG